MGRVDVMKLLIEITATVGSAITGIFAVGESTPLVVTSIGAVLGFATLLVRSVMANQRVYVDIVAGKDRELAQAFDQIHYLRWEAETLRYRHGERELDPGPYIPRRPPDNIPPPPGAVSP
jgi:hypothetical protein